MSTKIASPLQAAQLLGTTAQPSLDGDLAQQTFSERAKGPPRSPAASMMTGENHSQLSDHRTATAILKILNDERGTSRS